MRGNTSLDSTPLGKKVRRSIDNSDFSVLDVLAILALAVGIGFVVTYVAFREGLRNSRVAYRY